MTSIGTVVAIGVLLAMRVLVTRRASGLRLGWVGLAAVVAGTTIGPWMAHTYVKTGFPLSPLPVVVAGHRLGVAAPETEWYMTRPNLRIGDWAAERTALMEVVFGWRDSDT